MMAHPIVPPPSNLRVPTVEAKNTHGETFRFYVDWDARSYEYERLDPGYDQPGPIRRGELSWRLVAEAFVVFMAIVMFVFLASLVEVS